MSACGFVPGVCSTAAERSLFQENVELWQILDKCQNFFQQHGVNIKAAFQETHFDRHNMGYVTDPQVRWLCHPCLRDVVELGLQWLTFFSFLGSSLHISLSEMQSIMCTSRPG